MTWRWRLCFITMSPALARHQYLPSSLPLSGQYSHQKSAILTTICNAYA